MEIFDIHHHLGSLTGGSLQEGAGWQDRDYENRVRIMEANGVTMAAILAATGYIQADGIPGHDAFQRYGGRLSEARPAALPGGLWDSGATPRCPLVGRAGANET